MLIGIHLALDARGGGSGSSSAGNSAESQQFFNRLVTPPSGARETLYANLIDGLVADGTWSRLDALYVIGADEGTARENLIQIDYPMRRAFASATLTYNFNSGWTGGGGNRFMGSNYNVSTSPGKFQRNDAMIGAWCAAPDSVQNLLITEFTPPALTLSSNTFLVPDPGTTSWSVNTDGSTKSTASPTNTSGSWVMQRTGSATSELFFNGSTRDTNTIASAAPPNVELGWIPFNTVIVRAAWFGRALTSGQVSSLHTRVQTYIAAVSGVTP